VCLLDEVTRIAPDEDEDRDPFRQGRFDSLSVVSLAVFVEAGVVVVGDDDVLAERSIGQLPGLLDAFSDRFGRTTAEDAASPASETAATSSGVALSPKPTEKIG
jgi:hypothetical protein